LWRRLTEAFISDQTNLTHCRVADFTCLSVFQCDIKIKRLRRNNGRQSRGNSSAPSSTNAVPTSRTPPTHLDELFGVTFPLTTANTATTAGITMTSPSPENAIVVVVFAAHLVSSRLLTEL
jgi:hypothetical protein